MIWSYGITTFSTRVSDTFPDTLEALKAGGFPEPKLFIDSPIPSNSYARFGLPIVLNSPPVKVYGNGILALWNLFLTNPRADRYALFQDDILVSRNLRPYLETLDYQKETYWNLYTRPDNANLAPTKNHVGFYPSDQLGRGALGLVFDNKALSDLLRHPYLVNHATRRPNENPWKNLDGAISIALKEINYKELVHLPSLVYHTGAISLSENTTNMNADSFPGKDFDLMELV